VVSAQASLKTAEDELDKEKVAYQMDPRSISKDALDSAANALTLAHANLEIACKQRDLTKAGAWSFDIRNQERQYNALQKSYRASSALLSKYTLRAPTDGVVLSIATNVGNYVSPQGAYESYTQGMDPVIVLGTPRSNLQVRCYIDEILVPRCRPRSRHRCPFGGLTLKFPSTSSACSHLYRPRSSYPTSARNVWMCGCCRSFSS